MADKGIKEYGGTPDFKGIKEYGGTPDFKGIKEYGGTPGPTKGVQEYGGTPKPKALDDPEGFIMDYPPYGNRPRPDRYAQGGMVKHGSSTRVTCKSKG